MSCQKCILHKYRRNIVKGRGNIPAKILFIGEAPGRSEDLIGVPFIGRSGKLLNKMLSTVGINESDYYITNTVMCRPTDSKGGANREPYLNEVLACTQNVMEIYKKVNPKIVIFVGKVAEKYYKKEFPNSITIQHPSFLLRTGGENSSWYLINIQKLKEVANG